MGPGCKLVMMMMMMMMMVVITGVVMVINVADDSKHNKEWESMWHANFGTWM